MLNLLSNAVAFTEAGRISVRARGIEALNADTGCMEPSVEVSISDTGLAISRQRQRNGLQTSVLPDHARVSDCLVAGFGLPITEALIDLHGGRIWLGDEPGGGTTLTLLLPVNPLEAARTPPGGAVESIDETR